MGAFVFGLLSSLHCIGMCGPIALILPIGSGTSLERFFRVASYHMGRITSYGFLGLVFGLFGKGLYLAGLQQQVSIVLGILILMMALVPNSNLRVVSFIVPLNWVYTKLKHALGGQFRKKGIFPLYIIGLLNGFLPCAMIYVALFGAMSTQDVGLSVQYMVWFGIGTIFLMSLLIYIKDSISDSFKSKIMQVYPYVLVLIGVLFILRGLGLGIPFVSPDSLRLFIQPDSTC